MPDLTDHTIVAVVLHYNAAKSLVEVVDGIKNQTVKVGNIVIIDNASDLDLSARFKGDEKLTFIRLETNRGVGAGHNYGWKIAMESFNADLIWSLEHDSIPKPDCLEKLLAHYKPDALAAVGPVEDDGLDYDHKQYYVFHSKGLKRLSDKKKNPIYKGGMSFNGVLIPVTLLQRIGFLNEDFFVGREDLDFFKRIYKSKGHVLRVPEAQVFHNLYKENRPIHFLNKVFLFPNQSILREYYSYRNSVYMLKKQGVSHMNLYIRHVLGILLTVFFRNSKLTRVQNRIKAFKNGLAGNLGK